MEIMSSLLTSPIIILYIIEHVYFVIWKRPVLKYSRNKLSRRWWKHQPKAQVAKQVAFGCSCHELRDYLHQLFLDVSFQLLNYINLNPISQIMPFNIADINLIKSKISHLLIFIALLSFQQMNKQQITPWTIYDNSASKNQNEQKITKVAQKSFPSSRLVVGIKKEPQSKLVKINDLLIQIAGQKTKLNDRLNALTSLKIIRDQLSHENNPISHMKINLPKLGSQLNQYCSHQIKRAKIKHPHYSQKINIIAEIEGDIMEDFSKIFISKSLTNSPNIVQVQSKPEFPKIKKNQSVLLPQLNSKKQFDDNSIYEVTEQSRRKQMKRKSLASMLYDTQI